jgi:FdhD protein
MNEHAHRVEVLRFSDARIEAADDHVAAEMPLEVRLNGYPFAVIMRTPGADADLAAGFLFTEGIIRSAADIQRVDAGDAVNVVLARGRAEILPDLLADRRHVVQSSSCGLCGRRTVESLAVDRPALPVEWHLGADMVAAFPAALRRAQHAFDETGGLHAAGLFGLEGQLELSAEDIGRHNAVDKLLGRKLFDDRLPLSRCALVVSGRSSFEIVQKALLAGIPMVAAVSAPSSLAVDLARRAGITLLGFVRDGRFNVYAHPARVASSW